MVLDSRLDAQVPDGYVPDVLQVVRESLANVARHAGPCAVTITAEVVEGALVVQVADDGAGFTPHAPAVGRGLENVHERAGVLGGTIALDSAPGAGTTVTLTVPLP